MLSFSALQIAQMLGGEVKGNPSQVINDIGKIESATNNQITFFANPKYENFLYESGAGVILINKSFVPKREIKTTLILVDDPYLAFTKLLEEYHKFLQYSKVGVEEPAYIHESATIGVNHYRGAFSYIGKNSSLGNNVKIYPNVSIGDNVKIGDNTILYAGVKIYDNCVIGSNCKLHAGVVVGSDGFGFAPQADGTYKSIPQLGNVVIEDNVDVGANTVIDCATIGSTIIKKGVKLDNLIQIAHNVVIGSNTVIAAQAGISGSAVIGDNCMIGGQVGIVGHINIANKTKVGAQSGVSKTIEKEGTALSGSPAFDYKSQLKSSVIFKNLPRVQKQLEELEEKVINLYNKMD